MKENIIHLDNLRKQNTVILYGNEISNLFEEFKKLKKSHTDLARLNEIKQIFQEFLFGTKEAKLVLA